MRQDNPNTTVRESEVWSSVALQWRNLAEAEKEVEEITRKLLKLQVWRIKASDSKLSDCAPRSHNAEIPRVHPRSHHAEKQKGQKSLSPYLLFANTIRSEVRKHMAETSGLAVVPESDVLKSVAAKWKELSEEDKKVKLCC